MRPRSFVDIALDHSVRADCEEAVEAFDGFLSLPDEVRTGVTAVRNAQLGYRHGYMRETKKRAFDSDKEIFHYSPDFDGSIDPTIAKRREVRRVMAATSTLFNAVEAAVLRPIEAACRLAGVPTTALIEGDRLRSAALRVVRYDLLPVGGQHIPPHYDQGTFTACVFDSHPGLRLYPEGEPELVALDGEVGVLLTGMNFELESGGSTPPTWHDVVQVGEENRTSILFFADPPVPRCFTPAVRYECRTDFSTGAVAPMPGGAWTAGNGGVAIGDEPS